MRKLIISIVISYLGYKIVSYSPFISHLKEAWALRHHPNLQFLFYEDIIKDLPSTIKCIGKFLGKEVTEEEIVKLCEHLDINNFRKNQSVNLTWLIEKVANPNAEGFIRKGKSGGWRELFDEEMAAQATAWMRQNLVNTDLSFPNSSS